MVCPRCRQVSLVVLWPAVADHFIIGVHKNMGLCSLALAWAYCARNITTRLIRPSTMARSSVPTTITNPTTTREPSSSWPCLHRMPIATAAVGHEPSTTAHRPWPLYKWWSAAAMRPHPQNHPPLHDPRLWLPVPYHPHHMAAPAPSLHLMVLMVLWRLTANLDLLADLLQLWILLGRPCPLLQQFGSPTRSGVLRALWTNVLCATTALSSIWWNGIRSH
jgi:hypothetical protein